MSGCSCAEVGGVLLLKERVGFFFGETHELGRCERDLVRVEREQGFGGPILEGRNDLRHGVEHALRHWPGHGGDGDG